MAQSCITRLKATAYGKKWSADACQSGDSVPSPLLLEKVTGLTFEILRAFCALIEAGSYIVTIQWESGEEDFRAAFKNYTEASNYADTIEKSIEYKVIIRGKE